MIRTGTHPIIVVNYLGRDWARSCLRRFLSFLTTGDPGSASRGTVFNAGLPRVLRARHGRWKRGATSVVSARVCTQPACSDARYCARLRQSPRCACCSSAVAPLPLSRSPTAQCLFQSVVLGFFHLIGFSLFGDPVGFGTDRIQSVLCVLWKC